MPYGPTHKEKDRSQSVLRDTIATKNRSDRYHSNLKMSIRTKKLNHVCMLDDDRAFLACSLSMVDLRSFWRRSVCWSRRRWWWERFIGDLWTPLLKTNYVVAVVVALKMRRNFVGNWFFFSTLHKPLIELSPSYSFVERFRYSRCRKISCRKMVSFFI